MKNTEIELTRHDFVWHAALNALRVDVEDPIEFDQLVGRSLEYGAPASEVCVTGPVDIDTKAGSRSVYIVLSGVLELEAYFVAYKYGKAKAMLIEQQDVLAVASRLVSGMRMFRDVSPMHESDFLAVLKESTRLTDAKLAAILGVSRPVLSNMLRLQGIAPNVRKYVIGGGVSVSQARALASLPPQRQFHLAKMCSNLKWSYRELYAAAHPDSPSAAVLKQKDPDLIRFERVFSEKTGLDMNFEAMDANYRGVITFKFGTVGEIQRILSLIGKVSKSEKQVGYVQMHVDSLDHLDVLTGAFLDREEQD